ncbi:putative membrane protein [Actinopolyspora biskrensis]|uniref:Putative membrane protein n=1 Tax=Actinopolyspora biskrensis TaxID=1470178 RepID=A0A852ZEY2_9ACTN|nr:DUF6779 domain-containing protein [Actinopolyspora biskrensis]NYH80533.1 putative membrane protein [Actinopolyspora biskrensis]
MTLLWVGTSGLAVAATTMLILGDDVRLLRLGIVAALWAALLAALRASRLRERVRERDESLSRKQRDYERELEREIEARQQHESDAENEAHRRVREETESEISELRSELRDLRRLLERSRERSAPSGGAPPNQGGERTPPAATAETAEAARGESASRNSGGWDGEPRLTTRQNAPAGPAPEGGANARATSPPAYPAAPGPPAPPPSQQRGTAQPPPNAPPQQPPPSPPPQRPPSPPPQRPPRFTGAVHGAADSGEATGTQSPPGASARNPVARQSGTRAVPPGSGESSGESANRGPGPGAEPQRSADADAAAAPRPPHPAPGPEQVPERSGPAAGELPQARPQAQPPAVRRSGPPRARPPRAAAPAEPRPDVPRGRSEPPTGTGRPDRGSAEAAPPDEKSRSGEKDDAVPNQVTDAEERPGSRNSGAAVHPGAAGAHTQGTSVEDLLAAYGDSHEARRRRRRDE